MKQNLFIAEYNLKYYRQYTHARTHFCGSGLKRKSG